MKVTYEGVKYYVSMANSIERYLLKKRIKKIAGCFFRKLNRKDPCMLFYDSFLTSLNNPVVIDVGANIGMVTLPLAKKNVNGKFIAIEPHPLPASRFIQNCQLNKLDNVSLVSAAISPVMGLTKIYTCSSNSGGHRVTGFDGRDNDKVESSIGAVSVAGLPLKNIFKHFNVQCCDLLKVDVEGFEYQVLDSLEDLLSPMIVKAVVAEYGPEGLRAAGKTGWDVVEFMQKKGYKSWELQTGKEIESPKDIPLLPDHSVTDFLFLPAS